MIDDHALLHVSPERVDACEAAITAARPLVAGSAGLPAMEVRAGAQYFGSSQVGPAG